MAYSISDLINSESFASTSNYDNLFYAMLKCKGNGVGWKRNVQGFVKNGPTNCVELSSNLQNFTYEVGPYRHCKVFEPKERDIVAMYMKDRVIHRCFSDNYFYEKITRSFIYDNYACQKGKGTLRARERFKSHLQQHHRKYGCEGYMLKLDIHSFFGSIPHSVIMNNLKSKLDPYGLYLVQLIIDRYWTDIDFENEDKIGIFLGSIITQLLGVGTLDKLDHIIKEKFKIRHYSRYNDDMIMISKNKDELVKLLFYINEYLKNLGLTLNLNKTKIYKITDKIEFIGFDFRLTNTGYVVVTVPKHKVKYKKRKLRRMVKAANEGKFDKSTVDQHFKSYIQHISYGDTNKLQLNLTVYYNELWPDEPKLKIHDIQKEFKKPKMKNTYKLKNAA